MNEPSRAVATVTVANCPLCGEPGTIAREGLTDDLFSALGTWTFLRCAQDGLWWLSPRPRSEDLHLIYAGYYTHSLSCAPVSRLRGAIRDLKAAMLARGLGYPMDSSWLMRSIATALQRVRVFADIAAAEVMWLPSSPGKRLLDVGCGAGLFAGQMLQLGWKVEGIEPDPVAAHQAREAYGLRVYEGSLEGTAVPKGSYDAVTASHVVEHVEDSVQFLATCWDLLRPGGMLVVLTPNVESYAHGAFGNYWRGLEPPRHLTLFNPDALRRVAERAGVRGAAVRTSARAASFMWLMSDALRGHRARFDAPVPFSAFQRARALVFLLIEAARGGCCGEELLLTARKPAADD
jgi:2-polyprenyl-3-methyl-5-hydroxy-6-metoxy-1,4-benzoquinol methylase